ncbi:hypothetical protein NDU88_004291 [Pleurodeles waltl]|uniref:Uncharacterized protein n=1 Tax=Pleurodeles waltl TaxID=8319 RepID=A0AAV7NN43_PLEWA|nr:hypothetical protein NDU88_004291 [Pleurodeles waltl]
MSIKGQESDFPLTADGPTPLHDQPMDQHCLTTDRWTDTASRPTDEPTPLHDRPMDRHCLTTDRWTNTASRYRPLCATPK